MKTTVYACLENFVWSNINQKHFTLGFVVIKTEYTNSTLRKVLERCREKNLTLNWKKCHFMAKKGIVLGHVISPNGIEVDKVKTDLIINLLPPTIVKEVWSFLKHAGFCRCFIKDFSKIAKPLSTLLAKDVPFYFSEACQEALSLRRPLPLLLSFILPFGVSLLN